MILNNVSRLVNTRTLHTHTHTNTHTHTHTHRYIYIYIYIYTCIYIYIYIYSFNPKEISLLLCVVLFAYNHYPPSSHRDQASALRSLLIWYVQSNSRFTRFDIEERSGPGR